jgi:hypothetical protein
MWQYWKAEIPLSAVHTTAVADPENEKSMDSSQEQTARLRPWYDVSLTTLLWFNLKLAVAAVPALALLFSVYVFSVVFMQLALTMLAGG